MFSKQFTIVCLAATLALAPATKVYADLADGLVGGVVGGVVGGLIVNEGVKSRERNRNATTRSTTGYSPSYSPSYSPTYSPARQQIYEDQVALNYFGFPAGVPDGRRGRNTRNATSQYQAYMDYPITGRLNEWERQYLITSYQRAQSGGAATTQLISQNGQGRRGLLHAYRDESAGTAGYGNAGQTSTAAFADPGTQDNALGQTQPVAALPNLMGGQGNSPSLASHCNRVSLITSSNGGFVTEASMTDPQFALSEQFCLARTYAIAGGEQIASGLQGVSNADLETQCQGFGPAMREYVSALSLDPQQQVVRDVRGFILQSGMSPAQLSGTAKICLSVGYRTDNMDVALGSALLLTALGEDVYAELLGHHLNQGFGTAKRPDLALAWYQAGFDAIENGAEPVFVPGNPNRTALIRKAAYQVDGGQGSLSADTQDSIQPVSALPLFNVQD